MLTSLTNAELLQLEIGANRPPAMGIPAVGVVVGVVVGVEVGVEVEVGVGWAVSVPATSVATCVNADSPGCGAALPQALNAMVNSKPIAIRLVRLCRKGLILGETIFLFIGVSVRNFLISSIAA